MGTRLTIPTHVSPAGGQTTHPSVLFIEDGWNGFPYWMAHTPYPGGNDAHEDPNICVSDDGVTWFVPPGLTNPLDDQPGSPGALNSDVDLRFGAGNVMYLFWRTYDSGAPGAEETIYYRSSTDGINWTAKTIVYQTSQTVHRLVSPSLLFEDGHWVMWAVDVVSSPYQMVRLSGSAVPEGSWTEPELVALGALRAGRQPWHLNIIPDQGAYVGILTDIPVGASGTDGDEIFIASDDGFTWAVSPDTVIPRVQPGEHDMLYRATLIREGSGFRVWYAAWLLGPPQIWHIYRTFLTVEAGPEPEPEPERPEVGVATPQLSVTWLGCDLVTGRIISELPEQRGQVSRVLGAYTSVSLTMPIPIGGPGSMSAAGQSLAHMWEQATAPGQTMIVPVVNDVPAAGFVVLSRKGGTGAQLELGCVSLEGYLARRYVGDHTWADRDESSVIAAGLVADAQPEGIDLIIDAPATGTKRTREYLDGDDATVYQRLTELMAVSGGPEWTIDVDWVDASRTAVAKIFRVRKRIGAASVSPDAVFSTEGSSDAVYEYTEDYTDGRGANHVIAVGSGQGDDRPQSPPIDDVLDGWARYERRIAPSSSIEDVDVLTEHATDELDLRRGGTKTWAVTARWDAPPRLGVDWKLGDDIALELTGHRHPFGVTVVHRAIGWTLDMQAGTVTPLFLEATDGAG